MKKRMGALQLALILILLFYNIIACSAMISEKKIENMPLTTENTQVPTESSEEATEDILEKATEAITETTDTIPEEDTEPTFEATTEVTIQEERENLPEHTSEVNQETVETSPEQETQPIPEETTQETAEEFPKWYVNKGGLNLRNILNEVIDYIPAGAPLEVKGVCEHDSSRSWVEWKGQIGHVLNTGLEEINIKEYPAFQEELYYYGRTIAPSGLIMRNIEGERTETIPKNSLIYVMGISTQDPERVVVIYDGRIGTVINDFIEEVEDGLFVNIAAQTVTLIINGELIIHADCVTGWYAKWDTPKGEFTVKSVAEVAWLTDGKTYAGWYDSWVGFTWDGHGFHASPRTAFGGDIYKYNGSHGCINCSEEVARIIFEHAYLGMMVYIA